jgi:hypothetical protein
MRVSYINFLDKVKSRIYILRELKVKRNQKIKAMKTLKLIMINSLSQNCSVNKLKTKL